jgi:DNA-binding LacI/PurR family transcriptional regulator
VIVAAGSQFAGYLSPALTSFAAKLEPIGRRLAEMLLAAMPRYAGSEGPRILHEVWPLELTPRESDPPRKEIVKAANAGLGLGAALSSGR